MANQTQPWVVPNIWHPWGPKMVERRTEGRRSVGKSQKRYADSVDEGSSDLEIEGRCIFEPSSSWRPRLEMSCRTTTTTTPWDIKVLHGHSHCSGFSLILSQTDLGLSMAGLLLLLKKEKTAKIRWILFSRFRYFCGGSLPNSQLVGKGKLTAWSLPWRKVGNLISIHFFL